MAEEVKHPAKFSPVILDQIANLMYDYYGGQRIRRILDPFAGVGGIHQLRERGFETYAIELEPEWAAQSAKRGPTWCGDFFNFPSGPSPSFQRELVPMHFPLIYDAVGTSTTYGNRMADHHDAQEKCRLCFGHGVIYTRLTVDDFAEEKCEKCNGIGRREYKRLTYRHQLGRELTPNNSGSIQWGDKYRMFHQLAWLKVAKLVRPNGLFILNVKDHIRGGKIQQVSKWHRETCENIGFELLEDRRVDAKGMGFGKNQTLDEGLKVDYEHIFAFRRVQDQDRTGGEQ